MKFIHVHPRMVNTGKSTSLRVGTHVMHNGHPSNSRRGWVGMISDVDVNAIGVVNSISVIYLQDAKGESLCVVHRYRIGYFTKVIMVETGAVKDMNPFHGKAYLKRYNDYILTSDEVRKDRTGQKCYTLQNHEVAKQEVDEAREKAKQACRELPDRHLIDFSKLEQLELNFLGQVQQLREKGITFDDPFLATFFAITKKEAEKEDKLSASSVIFEAKISDRVLAIADTEKELHTKVHHALLKQSHLKDADVAIVKTHRQVIGTVCLGSCLLSK